MNEKRFTFVCDDENCRFKDNGKTIDCVEVAELLNEQQATIKQLQDKLFAMQHTIDNQENAIFHLKDTDDNLRKKNIRIEELSKVVHNLKMVLSSDDEQVAKIVGEQQATIKQLRQSVEYWQKKYEEGTETFQID